MIFGDKSTFAVEVAPLIKRSVDELLNCNFTYWIDGQQIGNLACEAPVCELEVDLGDILLDRYNRKSITLFNKSDCEIVKLVNQSIIDDAPYISEKGCWLAHNITYSMGHGYLPQYVDYWDVYVVEGDDKAKVIYVSSGKSVGCNKNLVPVGHVDRTLSMAWAYLVELLEEVDIIRKPPS